MEQVVLKDKVFNKYIPFEEIQRSIKELSVKVNADYGDKFRPIFLCVLNGSFMFMADLMKSIEIDCEVSFVKLSSYSATTSTGKVTELIGLSTDLSGRNVIVVEDIVDSGNSISALLKTLEAYNPNSVEVATLLFKPSAYKKDIEIKYVGISIPDDFIVGYGLDYDQLGRNLMDIYKIVE